MAQDPSADRDLRDFPSDFLSRSDRPRVFFPNPNHVRRRAEQRPLFFDRAQKLKQERSLAEVISMLGKIFHHPNR
ncbi:MAG TPA: hypothetical protein VN933_06425, partial [Candidatus Eremiobacteraceae bacterium]|nr:hypothetical protein [Candidatus Eremiobacteraceae bacterium]